MESSVFIRLVERLRDHEPGLFPTGTWMADLDEEIADLVTSSMAPCPEQFDLSYGLAVKAGLHLWNDSLHRSHVLSQDILTATGSYWHGMMHRMEGHYDDAKYWMGRALGHPVMDAMLAVKQRYIQQGDWDWVTNRECQVNLRQFYLQRSWDPGLFVDLVRNTVTSGTEPRLERALTAIQKQEIIMLLEFSYRNACGGHSLEPFN